MSERQVNIMLRDPRMQTMINSRTNDIAIWMERESMKKTDPTPNEWWENKPEYKYYRDHVICEP
jgi:hypothetical protein